MLSIKPANSGKRLNRIIAFAGGKGGVGKTVCTANLAYHLAEDHKVLAVDLDLGCGNLAASLGFASMSHSINDFIAGYYKELSPLKTSTTLQNLQFISCSSSPIEKTLLTAEQKEELLRSLRADGADYVLLDLGAGVNEDILDFFAAADVRVLVTTPESPALHNAFVFLKSLVFRVVVKSLEQCGFPKRTKDNIIRQLYTGAEIGRTMERIRSKNRVAGDFIRAVVSGIQVHVILNRTHDPSEAKFLENLQQLTGKAAHIELNYLGAIPFDDNVRKSLNDVVPFALEYKESPANEAFRSLAARFNRHLTELGFRSSRAEGGARPTAMRRLGRLIEGKLSSTAARLQSQSSADDELIKDYELTIMEFTRNVQLLRALQGKEQRDWRKKKAELEIEMERLHSELESLKHRHAKSEKKLEESVIRRDEYIEKLQQDLREKERIMVDDLQDHEHRDVPTRRK